MRAAVGRGQSIWSNGEDSKTRGAGSQHFTRLKVCFRVVDFVEERGPVHGKEVQTNTSPRAEGCPEQKSSQHQVERGPGHPAVHVEQREEEEHQQHTHHHGHGWPVGPALTATVPTPKQERREADEEPGACWKDKPPSREDRQRAIHEQHKVNREDEHRSTVMKVEG